MLPDCVESVMADLAFVFHWTPDVMDKYYLEELMDWREEARVRYQVDDKET